MKYTKRSTSSVVLHEWSPVPSLVQGEGGGAEAWGELSIGGR